MHYKIVIANEKILLKDLSQLSKKEQKNILKHIQELGHNPWPENLQVKKLKHYNLADFRLRVGSYRILFDKNTEKQEIILFRILHRSKLY